MEEVDRFSLSQPYFVIQTDKTLYLYIPDRMTKTRLTSWAKPTQWAFGAVRRRCWDLKWRKKGKENEKPETDRWTDKEGVEGGRRGKRWRVAAAYRD